MQSNQRYGASPQEWKLITESALRPYVLPIVSNPHIPAMEGSAIDRSNMRGKIPSVITGGYVCGLKSWPLYEASDEEIDTWSKSKDYGFCVRLGHGGFIAIDCDVNDATDAENILAILKSITKQPLALRSRGNARWATIIKIKDTDSFNKRVIHIQSGMVEFLGTGQQLACCGMHPSGTMYTWREAEPFTNIPEITAEQLDDFMNDINMIYAEEDTAETRASQRQLAETYDAPDSIADFLIKTGRVLAYGANRELYITCPWCEEHTTASGVRETAYFPKGSNGYDGGAFKCLHAHCAHRTIDDFRAYLELAGFEEVAADAYPDESSNQPEENETQETSSEDLIRAKLQQYVVEKTGAIRTGYTTVALAMACPSLVGYEFAYDDFSNTIQQRKPGTTEWHKYLDAECTIPIICRLEHLGFKLGSVAQSMALSVIEHQANKTHWNSAVKYIQENIPEWDGVERAERFFTTYGGAEDTEFTRAVGRYLFGMLWGRATATEPVKADISIIITGRQGTHKSTCVETLALKPEWFVGINMRSENKEIAQRIQGKLLVEVGEMAGMAKKDVDELKDFLTLKEDQWRPAYSRDQKVGVRHCLFIMTTNDDQFLTDSTGNRRYAVVNIDNIDIEKVKSDLHQLWAEGKHIYETAGVNKLHADVEALQEQYNEENVEEDPWEAAVLDWFEAEEFLKPKDRQFHDTRSILKFALGMTDAQIEKKHTKRLRNVLRRLKFEYKQIRKGLKKYKGWVVPKELKEELKEDVRENQTAGSAE